MPDLAALAVVVVAPAAAALGARVRVGVAVSVGDGNWDAVRVGYGSAAALAGPEADSAVAPADGPPEQPVKASPVKAATVPPMIQAVLPSLPGWLRPPAGSSLKLIFSCPPCENL
ncbi:hypothetical protein GCM10028789_26880 [Sinomonas halotolerans]